MEGKNTHSVTNGSISQNETRGYQPELSWVELPPPYSVENQPQQQNVWSPQATNAGLYDPPFSYPGGKPAEQHDGFYPYHPAAATSRAAVLSEDEIRRGQEAYMRHLHVMASAMRTLRPSLGRRLARLGFMLFVLGLTLLIVLCVLIVHPALYDMQLKHAQCTVISSYETVEKSCNCGRSCKSHYPCLEIQVTFHANGEKQTAYLYENVYAGKNKVSRTILRNRIIMIVFTFPAWLHLKMVTKIVCELQRSHVIEWCSYNW